jgi:carbon storage regulator
MLVLSRKRNEAIVINGNIRIMVVDIRGNQVRLGIEAPNSVGILREELCERAGTGNERAAFAQACVASEEAARCSIE